jgi:hypothetical protein
MDKNFAFLRYLILSDHVEVRERFMHKGSYISSLLKNLRVGIIVDELQQLIKYFLYVVYFFEVTGH